MAPSSAKKSIMLITTILLTSSTINSTWSTSNQVPGCSVHCTPGPSERCIKYTEFSAGKLAYTSRWMRSWWWWMVIKWKSCFFTHQEYGDHDGDNIDENIKKQKFVNCWTHSFCGRITLDWTSESPDNSRFAKKNSWDELGFHLVEGVKIKMERKLGWSWIPSRIEKRDPDAATRVILIEPNLWLKLITFKQILLSVEALSSTLKHCMQPSVISVFKRRQKLL